MRPRTYLAIASLLGFAGTGFSGYLAATRYLSGSCAFDDPCPFFLGQPACYIGFALFAASFLPTALALATHVDSPWPASWNLLVSTVGALFAGRMAIVELASGAPGYAMGMPTCAYGFFFFAALLVLSSVARFRRPTRRDDGRAAPPFDAGAARPA